MGVFRVSICEAKGSPLPHCPTAPEVLLSLSLMHLADVQLQAPGPRHIKSL